MAGAVHQPLVHPVDLAGIEVALDGRAGDVLACPRGALDPGVPDAVGGARAVLAGVGDSPVSAIQSGWSCAAALR